jgi:hypothetical protein
VPITLSRLSPGPSVGPVFDRRIVQAQFQNSIAVLAVVAAIALLAVTLVVPRKSLLVIEMPAAYADAS